MSSSPTERRTRSTDEAKAGPAAPGRETQGADGALEVQMPQMGISVSEGTIIEWRKAVGDTVAADEAICDVTTDKVDVEIPSPAAGVLARIVAEPGQTVPVGAVIAAIDPAQGNGHGSVAAAGQAPETGVATPGAGADEADRSRFYSPVVRRIAAEHDVDLESVQGRGVGGRVRKQDLLAHLESAAPEPTSERPLHTESPYVPDSPVDVAEDPPVDAAEASAAGRREPMSPMRRSIADHMVRSIRTAAHCTTIVEVDFSAIADRRAALKEGFERKGVPLTYLAFVARAVVEALEELPVLNASVDGEELVFHEDVNLGIAVSLPAERGGGLIVPVIPQAQRLSLEGTAAAIADLATRARERRLDPGEVQGGTFTITNPGQFGAVLATPILNQPQVGILDLESIVKRPVVVENAEGEAIAIRPMAYLPMSWDHRALDGADAARFLGLVKARLESGAIS